MPIAITSEHNDLAASVRSLVARVAPSEVLHEALETPISNPPPYWAAAADQGLQGLHLSEAVGGQGFGILELAITLAEFGYGAVPGPFVPSAIASALIAAHDPKSALLPGLASGEIIAAYALNSGLTATTQGDGLVVSGEIRAVPAAAQAELLVVPVDNRCVALDTASLQIDPVQSVDPLHPVAHVRADAVPVAADRILTGLDQSHARALITTLLSAACVGVARWATDTAAAYAKIREQFGRPIGQFQAIKHKCANMIAETERATGAVWDAARALDEHASGDADSDYLFAAAVAATLAPVAAQHCAQDCIQVHGGIGFTWEHDTNVYYRHAIALVAGFGRAADHPRQVVDLATTSGMRSIDIDLDPDTEKLRAEIRAEVAALKALPSGPERNAAIAEGGWVQPHLPTPWGRAAEPIEQIIIAQEFSTGKVRRPQMGIAAWIIPSIVAFGTHKQQQDFLPPTFRGDMIWCQLFSEPGAGSLDQLVEFLRDGEFDELQRHEAGKLIAEGHAAKLLNMRSTLLTLAGGDPMPAAAISKLLSMKTGQGYAEFGVASFGSDAVVGDPQQPSGRWDEYLLAGRATTIYGGTSEVQLNIIAERLLGLPRDP